MSSPQSTVSRATRDTEAALNDITDRGIAAIRGARDSVDDAVAEMSEKGREAMRGAREVRDTFSDAILSSIKTRPYTALAIAGLAGFLYGAMRR